MRAKHIIITLFIFMSTVITIFAQDDGRVSPSPGDRVIAYCHSTTLEIWGAADTGGTFLASFFYNDLVPNQVQTAFTNLGKVEAVVDIFGNITVRWVGGRLNASGTGDFAKHFQCPFDPPFGAYVPELSVQQPITNTVPVSNVFGPVQQVTTSVTVTQTITLETNITTCGSSVYTVRTGDNLFRIALRYGTTVQALASCNGISDPSRIYIGQQIYVP